MTTTTTMNNQTPLPDAESSGYTYKENVLVAPVWEETMDQWRLDVRLETHSELDVVTLGADAEDESSFNIMSPFPEKLLKLLKRYKALLNIQLQVNNRASSSFPVSPLDYYGVGVSSDSSASLPPRTTTAPSGVFVRMQWLVDEENNDDVSLFKKAFVSILCEIVGQRILLAPLLSIENKRLHRYIHSERLILQSEESDDNNTTTAVVQQLTTVLPMEGSPMASEGLRAFLQLAPCQEAAGILGSVNDANEWSNTVLLGAASSRLINDGLLSRGMWLNFGTSQNCYHRDDSAATEGQGYGGGPCRRRWTFSQGLHYSVAKGTTSSSAATSSSSAMFSLSDLFPMLPPANKNTLALCPLADSTMVHVVMPLDDDDASEEAVQFQSACPRTSESSTSVLASAQLNNTAPIQLSEPCFMVTQQRKQRKNVVSLDDDATTTAVAKQQQQQPYWHIHLDVLRSSGLANGGTLLTLLRNEHQECGAQVSVLQIIPPVVEPIWQSLHVVVMLLQQQEQSTTTTTSNNSVKEEIFRLPWTSLDEREISFAADGSILLQFQHRLPPSSSLTVSLDYDPAFLSFETFPGDPNRGFELPPVRAHFTTTSDDCSSQLYADVMLYSNAVLLLAPLPDMSMPFNVLSLTCTLYAFVIGSLINLLVRKASERVKYQLDPSKKPKSKLQQIKERVKERVGKLIGKKPKRQPKEPPSSDTAPAETAAATATASSQKKDS